MSADQTFAIPCPKCGKEIQQFIAGLKPVLEFTCADCGERFTLQTEGLELVPDAEVMRLIKGDGLPN